MTKLIVPASLPCMGTDRQGSNGQNNRQIVCHGSGEAFLTNGSKVD